MRTEKTVVAVRRYSRTVGARAVRLYVRARRNRQRLLVAALALGVLFMVIHWG
jgi:hypothetical protein